MRYINGDKNVIRFGWVVVDSSVRGKGYGTQMLRLGIKYAFEILGAEKITIGVFENNTPAHTCYKKVGFADVDVVKDGRWNIIEMEINKNQVRNDV
jgi:RimJ/RimL family protein N-acetyltransferase